MRHAGPATAVLLALALTGCGGLPGGARVEGPAPSAIPWSGPVYIDDARSIPRQSPDVVDLTDVTTLYGLKWHGWGTPRAVATGLVVDFACVSGCPHGDSPSFPAGLVLTGLVKREYAAYYSHAVLTPDHPPAPGWALDVGPVRLRVPKA
ncbi:hypothetical protein IAG44_18320 [Streptomyces roseirectus]|uniref:Lipoprotein n=1 Tax=Streptomyces roseirectus TaxID=2768066 RepID=A0A7H0IEI4_9ACTN|nr:hypothetical protein [Streptomyces roseirectus]QNP71200.1 hypothetical protein IAG44_18320 [Streptomyces roseirectus]